MSSFSYTDKLILKAVKVVLSCNTNIQLTNALKYSNLVEKQLYQKCAVDKLYSSVDMARGYLLATKGLDGVLESRSSLTGVIEENVVKINSHWL